MLSIKVCQSARFQIRLATFIWLFAFMETLLYYHTASFDSIPPEGDSSLTPSVRGAIVVRTTPAISATSPCETLVQKRNNRLICTTMHTLWESFPAPTNMSESFVNRALPNIIQRETSSTGQDDNSADSIVLATHLGVQKLDTLLVQARWWGGPISAGIYMTSPDEIDAFVQFVEEHEFTLRHTSFHAVLEKTNLPYPHNVLRNLAMDYLDGDFFVAADVDFIPGPDSHQNLVNLFASSPRLRQKLITKTVMVLAAFERHMPSSDKPVTEDLLPKTKAEVIDMVKSGKGNGFHMAGSSAGHGPTDFDKWIGNKTNEFYGIEYKNIFEPYILGYRRGIPRYWSDFRGYGFNKFSFFFEINKAGYDFAVLRDFYICHMNHPIPDLKKKKEMTDANREHWKKFKDYLSKQYAKKKQ